MESEPLDKQIEELRQRDADGRFLVKGGSRTDCVEGLLQRLHDLNGDVKQRVWDFLVEELSKYSVGNAFFNNFHARLPRGVRRADCIYHPLETDDLVAKDYMESEKLACMSEIRKNQSLHDFFYTINLAVIAMGYTLEQAVEAKKRGREGNDWDEFKKIQFLTYLKLREWGYTHGELIT